MNSHQLISSFLSPFTILSIYHLFALRTPYASEHAAERQNRRGSTVLGDIISFCHRTISTIHTIRAHHRVLFPNTSPSRGNSCLAHKGAGPSKLCLVLPPASRRRTCVAHMLGMASIIANIYTLHNNTCPPHGWVDGGTEKDANETQISAKLLQAVCSMCASQGGSHTSSCKEVSPGHGGLGLCEATFLLG